MFLLLQNNIQRSHYIPVCRESICAHHLREPPKCLNENSIKCMECHLKFKLEEGAISLNPNKHLRKFLVNKFEMYLETHEEKRIQSTKQLETNPRLLFLLQTVRNQLLSAQRITLNLMVVNPSSRARGDPSLKVKWIEIIEQLKWHEFNKSLLSFDQSYFWSTCNQACDL